MRDMLDLFLPPPPRTVVPVPEKKLAKLSPASNPRHPMRKWAKAGKGFAKIDQFEETVAQLLTENGAMTNREIAIAAFGDHISIRDIRSVLRRMRKIEERSFRDTGKPRFKSQVCDNRLRGNSIEWFCEDAKVVRPNLIADFQPMVLDYLRANGPSTRQQIFNALGKNLLPNEVRRVSSMIVNMTRSGKVWLIPYSGLTRLISIEPMSEHELRALFPAPLFSRKANKNQSMPCIRAMVSLLADYRATSESTSLNFVEIVARAELRYPDAQESVPRLIRNALSYLKMHKKVCTHHKGHRTRYFLAPKNA